MTKMAPNQLHRERLAREAHRHLGFNLLAHVYRVEIHMRDIAAQRIESNS